MLGRPDRRVFDEPGERLLLRQALGDLASRLWMTIEVGKAVALTWR